MEKATLGMQNFKQRQWNLSFTFHKKMTERSLSNTRIAVKLIKSQPFKVLLMDNVVLAFTFFNGFVI